MGQNELAVLLYNQRVEELENEIAALKVAFDRCESPAERALLMAYVSWFHPVPYVDNGSVFLIEDHDGISDYVTIVPQLEIKQTEKPYRADFLFLRMGQDKEPKKQVVVEVDGHDFHERTKEQARRDRSRDRDMLKSGFYVLRYTGSEVYRDVKKAVQEIRAFVLQGSEVA